VLKINGILEFNVTNSSEFKTGLDRHNKNEGIFNLPEILIETAGFESIYSKRVQSQS
jgi:hypothetical protein